MNTIHPSAIVGQNVKLGSGNRIDAHVIIEDNVIIGSNNTVRAGAYIAAGTEIKDSNEIHMHAVIGHIPQDISFKNEPSYTRIGSHNQIREFSTIHRGTKPGSATLIGDYNFIMAYCHIAHNCILGNRVIMVNQASLTGYCEVGDNAFLSGMTGFHQFTRIGRLALVSALSAVNKDIPPFMICGGRPGVILGMNVVGMRRAGVLPASRDEIKKAYKLLYRSGLNTTQALEAIKSSLSSPEVTELVQFIENSKRGICDAATGEDSLKPRKNSSAVESQ
ncbi:MAG: acyl-ACP--UDP-N-acetylglucosamine O-acyltransferase [Candidatus Omnitrophica bacterium]|nr:acyl-ACP--UDP-N-acetylglucosamine O-acyltransferase [Candidatus Omnitrophota bacterium]